MNTEKWLPIEGWEGMYEISDHGMVRSLDRRVRSAVKSGGSRLLPGRLMTPHVLKTGHCHARLNRDGKTTEKLIHRLVLAAFVGPCPEGMEGCHNDGNPGNNHVSNLRWDTHLENQRDIIRHGRHWAANKTHCKSGHEFTEKNTRVAITKQGGPQRNCRECERLRAIPKNARRSTKRRGAGEAAA